MNGAINMEYNGWDEVRKFRGTKMGFWDDILSAFFIGRETPRNKWHDRDSIPICFLMLLIIAAIFGLAKLFIGIPFVTVIGLGLALGACAGIPNIYVYENYLIGIVTSMLGVIGYFLPFMTLKIFSFDLFPYFMLIMIASGVLAMFRRSWNQMAWHISDYLYEKYGVAPIDEAHLEESYENKDFRESTQDN